MARFLREQVLQSTIKKWASTDCAPHPCGLEVWRYTCAVSGIEAPALPFHQTRRDMVRLLKDKGGLEQYARTLMLSLNWIEVNDPRRGDVAVVDIPGMGLTCAICLGSKWLARGNRNVLSVAAPHRAAWRFYECLK